MSEFKDVNIILNELEQLFNRDDDIKDVLDIRKMQSEIETQCAVRLKDTKEIIRGKFYKYLRSRQLLLLIIFPFRFSSRWASGWEGGWH